MVEHHGPKPKHGKNKTDTLCRQILKRPMLVTVGEQDFRVPLNNSIENGMLTTDESSFQVNHFPGRKSLDFESRE
jgi:hypothetical protein